MQIGFLVVVISLMLFLDLNKIRMLCLPRFYLVIIVRVEMISVVCGIQVEFHV